MAVMVSREVIAIPNLGNLVRNAAKGLPTRLREELDTIIELQKGLLGGRGVYIKTGSKGSMADLQKSKNVSAVVPQRDLVNLPSRLEACLSETLEQIELTKSVKEIGINISSEDLGSLLISSSRRRIVKEIIKLKEANPETTVTAEIVDISSGQSSREGVKVMVGDQKYMSKDGGPLKLTTSFLDRLKKI